MQILQLWYYYCAWLVGCDFAGTNKDDNNRRSSTSTINQMIKMLHDNAVTFLLLAIIMIMTAEVQLLLPSPCFLHKTISYAKNISSPHEISFVALSQRAPLSDWITFSQCASDMKPLVLTCSMLQSGQSPFSSDIPGSSLSVQPASRNKKTTMNK